MIANLTSKIRNGYMVYHESVQFKDIGCCTAILDILAKNSLISGYSKNFDDRTVTIYLRYPEGVPGCNRIIMLSRPSRRVYLTSLQLVRFHVGTGVLIVSTNKGIMTHKKAVQKNLGGEVLIFAS